MHRMDQRSACPVAVGDMLIAEARFWSCHMRWRQGWWAEFVPANPALNYGLVLPEVYRRVEAQRRPLNRQDQSLK